MNDFQKYEQADAETCRKGMAENNIYAKTRMTILTFNENDPKTLSNAIILLDEVAAADPKIMHLLFNSAKERGELGAFYGLFLIWHNGMGEHKNIKLALKYANPTLANKYLEYAAKHGYTHAEAYLGRILGPFNLNYDIKRNNRKAEKYLLRAANKNSASAHTTLFHFYADKKKPAFNVKAVNHLLQAVKINPAEFEFSMLSYIYKNNDPEYEFLNYIVETDLVQSVMWSYVSCEFGFLNQKEMDQESALISWVENIQARKMAMDWIKAWEQSSTPTNRLYSGYHLASRLKIIHDGI